MALILRPDLNDMIGAHAKGAFPGECCGLLEGHRGRSDIVVEAIWPTRNLSSAPDRFEIDPADHFRVLRAARERGRSIIGCFHSHPNGLASPSPRDRDGASDEHFIWIIAALNGAGMAPAILAYEYEGGAFVPLAIRTSIASSAGTFASR